MRITKRKFGARCVVPFLSPLILQSRFTYPVFHPLKELVPSSKMLFGTGNHVFPHIQLTLLHAIVRQFSGPIQNWKRLTSTLLPPRLSFNYLLTSCKLFLPTHPPRIMEVKSFTSNKHSKYLINGCTIMVSQPRSAIFGRIMLQAFGLCT